MICVQTITFETSKEKIHKDKDVIFLHTVDHETYLHQEEDPRYRGAAIPSRAFRFLQNMTESNDSSVTCTGKTEFFIDNKSLYSLFT